MPSAAMGSPDGYGPTDPSGAARKIWNDPQPGRPRTGPNGETLGFADFLDIINPLQHIPIVSTIYRSITGDQINPGSRLIGSTLLGGPVGFAVASANVASQMATGRDVGEGLIAQLTGQGESAEPPPSDVVMASAQAPTANAFAPGARPDGRATDRSPPAANPWSIDFSEVNPTPGNPSPGNPTPIPVRTAQPPAPATPAAQPPLPSQRPATVNPMADPQSQGASQPSGIHAAVQPRPVPTPVEANDPRPLVGPRQESTASQKAFFLPQPVVPPLAGPANAGPVPLGSPQSPQPGALAMTGPLSLPLTPQPGDIDKDADDRRARNEEERNRQSRDQREAALAIDRFLRQAAIDSEQRAANPKS
ncbi:MAG: hypothetical protein AAFW76_11535 [Pseudomonadota bacterium]